MKQRGVLAAVWAMALAGTAAAQPGPHRPMPRLLPQPPPLVIAQGPNDDPTDLRARFGVERIAHLLHEGDEAERLRGLERAAALGTPEAVARLVQQLDASSQTRSDPRAKIAIARGLAAHVDQAVARSALVVLVGLATPRPSSQRAETEDPDFAPRLELARGTAALALVRSGDEGAVEALIAIARGTGPGVPAATAALSAFPPSGSATAWTHPMSAATVRLVAATEDRRALSVVLEAAKGGDAETRAAAIETLGALGDARVLEVARAALIDPDARVRLASGGALVALGAPEAAHAVEQLLGDEATAARAIDLAMIAHGPGIVRALTAKAAISADLATRSAAVAALGRDPTAEGIEALSALAADPILRAVAADAMARSPSVAAMKAIETLAAVAATRRVALRAYVVRALVREETSGVMDRLRGEMARSTDARDRAAAVFAGVALGDTPLRTVIDDADAGVRRAAVMGAMGTIAQAGSTTGAALRGRLAGETDPATRAVLGAGLIEEGTDAHGWMPTRALLACAHEGGADAAICTLAFARRASRAEATEVDALLASSDPILRAHAARGLGVSGDPTRAGRLAAAYAYEPDPLVRRAILTSLATVPRDAPAFSETLPLAARLDPDPEARWTAARILEGRPPPVSDASEVAWVRLVDPAGSPPPPGTTGTLLRADGLALPIAFDADGDALVPGVPTGPARLLLAPRPDATYTRSP